jgi:hypothetical protein
MFTVRRAWFNLGQNNCLRQKRGTDGIMEIFRIILSVPFEFKVGDPTFFGWLTVVVYLITAVLCAVCAVRAAAIFGEHNVRLHQLIWTGLAIGLAFLGINKQLDLQTWFTTAVKYVAYEQGWYAAGQRAQILFVFGLIAVSGIGGLIIAWTLRASWRQYWVLLFGALFIARFVIVRAASFYGVSLPELSQLTGGFRINWLLEVAGSAVISFAAWRNLQGAKIKPPTGAVS